MPSAAPRLSLTVALALAVGACHSSNEPCEVETLRVRMPATVVRHGQSTTTELSFELNAGQFSTIAAFEATRSFFTDASAYAGTIAWEILATDAPLHFGIVLQGPRQSGEVLQVSPGVLPATWGPLAPPNGAVAAAAVVVDAADGTSFAAMANDGDVSGTLEVLAVAPLKLRLDLVATSAAGEEMRIQGDMVAEHSGNALGCD